MLSVVVTAYGTLSRTYPTLGKNNLVLSSGWAKFVLGVVHLIEKFDQVPDFSVWQSFVDGVGHILAGGLFMSLVSGVVFWDKCQRQSFASITVPDVLNSKNAEAKCCLSATTVTYHVVLGVVVRFWMQLSHECRGQATRLLCIYPRDASTVLVEHSMTSCCVTARAIQLTPGVLPSVSVRTNGKASHCVAMQQSKKHQLIRKPIGCSKSKKPQFSDVNSWLQFSFGKSANLAGVPILPTKSASMRGPIARFESLWKRWHRCWLANTTDDVYDTWCSIIRLHAYDNTACGGTLAAPPSKPDKPLLLNLKRLALMQPRLMLIHLLNCTELPVMPSDLAPEPPSIPGGVEEAGRIDEECGGLFPTLDPEQFTVRQGGIMSEHKFQLRPRMNVDHSNPMTYGSLI